MIGIVNYGLGNIAAFANVYRSLGLAVRTIGRPEEFADVDRIVIPGVGAFDHAISSLESSGLRPVLEERVRGARVPVLGVCVGMQILMESSDEGRLPGLGWIAGSVRRFAQPAGGAPLAVPHMGWNDVRPVGNHPLFKGLDRTARFYFLHSYYVTCTRPEGAIGVSDHGGTFTAAIGEQNVLGVQFHPEKSHGSGQALLRNFAGI